LVRPERAESVEGTEPVKRLLFRAREDNFVSPPRAEGMGPTRMLARRLSTVRPVRAESVEGTEPVKRLLFRSREDNFVSPPRAEGMGPMRLFPPRLRIVRPERAERVEGREPVKLFVPNDSEMTSPAPEQVSPVHTGDEHLLATLAQLQREIWDWILVELIRAHRAEFSSGSVGEEVGAVVEGAVLGEIRAIFLTRWLWSSATRA
jgi:hypothetical protein